MYKIVMKHFLVENHRILHFSHVLSWYTHLLKGLCVYQENTSGKWVIPWNTTRKCCITSIQGRKCFETQEFHYRSVKSSCPPDEKVNEMCGNASASKHKYIFLTSQLELQLRNYFLQHANISATMLEAQPFANKD